MRGPAIAAFLLVVATCGVRAEAGGLPKPASLLARPQAAHVVLAGAGARKLPQGTMQRYGTMRPYNQTHSMRGR
jgi:hypothetical protein